MEIKALIGYDRIKRIGVGQGMNSEVYLVHDPQRAERVVAKEIDRPKLVNDPDILFQECHAICASNASNVVPILYGCRTKEKICLVMPYYKNGSLGDRIENGPIRPKEVIRVGQQMLSGISRIHAQGYIHFDVKPTNILFDDNDNAVVADFGQTQKMGPTGICVIPAMYMFGLPPEYYTAAAASIHSDIYHAGLTLYRAANGDPLFTSQKPATEPELQARTISGKFPNRNMFMPHVPRFMRTVIRKALKVDPAERYQSAAEMAQSLANVSVKNDWSMTISGSDFSWRAKRVGRPDLIVELSGNGMDNKVEIYTDGGTRRAKDTALWQAGVNRTAALDYLNDLFDQWERA